MRTSKPPQHGILSAMRELQSGPAGDRERTDRDPPAPELPAEHALLGLLALAGGTAHGYELARQFRRGQPLGEVIRLESAMLYKHLKKLARLGWLTMTIEEQAPRATAAGLRAHPGGRDRAAPLAGRTRGAHSRDPARVPGQALFRAPARPLLARRLADEQHAVTAQLTYSLTAQLSEAARRGG